MYSLDEDKSEKIAAYNKNDRDDDEYDRDSWYGMIEWSAALTATVIFPPGSVKNTMDWRENNCAIHGLPQSTFSAQCETSLKRPYIEIQDHPFDKGIHEQLHRVPCEHSRRAELSGKRPATSRVGPNSGVSTSTPEGRENPHTHQHLRRSQQSQRGHRNLQVQGLQVVVDIDYPSTNQKLEPHNTDCSAAKVNGSAEKKSNFVHRRVKPTPQVYVPGTRLPLDGWFGGCVCCGRITAHQITVDGEDVELCRPCNIERLGEAS
mmetsp:Transcript_1904/g.3932  ORF Transcript_1904/g.3932 Transcript_1904/m.3932 type:complete len:262 (-) Transcript_1904:565-1350(-)|eukprot:CAMPEP_0114245824 /NCGR_PEP_ID=MMETSP0058-20121206/12118_1 /TAXON_ID=36894 /ORGANISM="Pyramimonas parkeae, CCMP726" /LENGTH=261 /DNA_ID=CAMNT_0001358935 /DNA_START=179 /DNA_END=964 /DNA_ORIENTATION=+